jgi:hypothetical protein
MPRVLARVSGVSQWLCSARCPSGLHLTQNSRRASTARQGLTIFSFLDGEATKLAESPGTVARKIRKKLQRSSAHDGATQPTRAEAATFAGRVRMAN